MPKGCKRGMPSWRRSASKSDKRSSEASQSPRLARPAPLVLKHRIYTSRCDRDRHWVGSPKILRLTFSKLFRDQRRLPNEYRQPLPTQNLANLPSSARMRVCRTHSSAVNNVRTVSDTKRAFYTIHTRPINSIYRRVVEELMVEMHLLAVNADFRYDPFYALGVFTSFHRFMQAYRPEPDIASIFDGLCKALQDDPQRYRQDAARLESLANRSSAQEIMGWLEQSESIAEFNDLQEQARAVANNPDFKYSR